MKTCYKCKECKTLPYFHKDKTKFDGYNSLCKECVSTRDRNRKSYFIHRRPNKKIYDQNYKKENKTLIKSKSLKYVYGMTIEQYTDLLKIQNHSCAICKIPESLIDYRTGKIRDLSVDHCHSSNKIRGLLCSKCNVALGNFKDDIEVLTNAICYLKSNLSSKTS